MKREGGYLPLFSLPASSWATVNPPIPPPNIATDFGFVVVVVVVATADKAAETNRSSIRGVEAILILSGYGRLKKDNI